MNKNSRIAKIKWTKRHSKVTEGFYWASQMYQHRMHAHVYEIPRSDGLNFSVYVLQGQENEWFIGRARTLEHALKVAEIELQDFIRTFDTL